MSEPKSYYVPGGGNKSRGGSKSSAAGKRTPKRGSNLKAKTDQMFANGEVPF